jgi:sterol desaturase/sphingolipid hydroxylase (fatty acid hydroxylase superfamily)
MIRDEILEYEYMKPVEGDEPIQLFEDDRLERFAHTPPIVAYTTWVIVSLGGLTWTLIRNPRLQMLVPFAVGILVWTFVEYMMHRFIFHIGSGKKIFRKMSFVLHGVHHAQPRVKTRLMMPLAAGIPIALLFLGFFYVIAGLLIGAGAWVLPLFSGFMFGYVLYSSAHYAIHALPNVRFLEGIRKYHLLHHGTDYTVRYGISSPLWDYVFGTHPRYKRNRNNDS